MNLDNWLRIGTFAIAVIGGAKIIYDAYAGRTSRARDEYRFAKEFLRDIEGDLHPFLKDKGYKAISGNDRITPEEASYLIELKDPVRALKDFSLGMDYVELSKESPRHFISFKKKYARPWSRRWRKGLFVFLYIILAMGTLSPLMLSKAFGNFYTALTYFCLFVVFLGMPAIAFLKWAVRIYRAEQLEKNQSRHRELIVAP